MNSFLLMDPHSTIRLHPSPFWLVFCPEPSAKCVRRFLDSQPSFDETGLMLLPHGTEGVGVASIEKNGGNCRAARREKGAFLASMSDTIHATSRPLFASTGRVAHSGRCAQRHRR